jgi:hemolysin activation/secretion protein
MMSSGHPARARLKRLRIGFIAFGISACFAAEAAPPPLPPPGSPPPLPALPLPSAAQPGGAQPVMPPPTIPIPENNLDLSVPPVYERPLGAEEGERVFVKRFVITGVVGDRKAGIDPEQIQKQVDEVFASIQSITESQRLTKQNLEKQSPEGFTPEEQEKIIKFMQGAVKNSSPEDQQKQYQAFIQQLMLERLQRLQGLTIGQLQAIADGITKYYHDKGYFLARAVIPAQEIKDGVVNIRVLEGRLEKVQTSGNKMYSDKVLAKPFKPLIGELVTIDRTENALLTLTKYPGLSAAGVFRPGEDVGTTDIVVNVQNEKRFDGSVRADNDGTAFTGRDRLIGSLDVNDLTGDADLLTATVLKTFGGGTTDTSTDPKTKKTTTVTNPAGHSTYGDLRYERPVYDAYNKWALDISRNGFTVGALGGLIGGVSKIAVGSFEHDFYRSRTSNLIGTIDLSRKRADTTTGGKVTNRDDLAVLGGQFNLDNINTDTNTISTVTGRFEHGFAGALGVPNDDTIWKEFAISENKDPKNPPDGYLLPSRGGAETVIGTDGKPHTVLLTSVPSFNKWTFNYQLYKNLPHTQGLLFRFGGQYSRDMLSSLEQFVMGGSDSVRAAPTSQFLVDNGLFSSLEYSVSSPGFADKHAFGSYTWGQVLRFKVFLDAARGYNNHPVGATNRQFLAGSGVGLTFTVPGSFTADLQWARLNGGARPGTGLTDPTRVRNSSELWLDMTYNF